MNRKWPIAAAGCVLIAAGALIWLQRSTDEIASPLTASTQERAASIDDSTAMRMDPSGPSGAAALPGGVVDESQFCNRKPACVNDPYTPNSEAELRWMQQHGFPTKSEQERLSRLSDVELEAEAKRGVLTAMTALGSRMIERGDNNGLSWHLRAADRGSIYAYYANSAAELKIKRIGLGITDAGAFLRVAYILGDHKAGPAIFQLVEKNGMGMIEMYEIDRRAGELYQTYAKNRMPSPRPR